MTKAFMDITIDFQIKKSFANQIAKIAWDNLGESYSKTVLSRVGIDKKMIKSRITPEIMSAMLKDLLIDRISSIMEDPDQCYYSDELECINGHVIGEELYHRCDFEDNQLAEEERLLELLKTEENELKEAILLIKRHGMKIVEHEV